VRLMRTITAITAATVILLTAGTTAASASRPTIRPGGDQAVGHLIRQHDCRPGATYGGGVTGWLLDDVTTPRRELVYRDIDHASNGGGQQRWAAVFSCYR